MQEREHISVVWLKRDLRLHDNEAITNAFQSGQRVLILYVFETILLEDPHYDTRHWNFIKQSLEDINCELVNYNTKVLTVTGDVLAVFSQLNNHYKVTNVYSHQETGLRVTFDRDKAFKRFCRNHMIEWKENINNGVLRGILNRNNWFEKWEQYMYAPQLSYKATSDQCINSSEIDAIKSFFVETSLNTKKTTPFQYGGRSTALKYLQSFLDERHKNYMFNISKPAKSRISCSRLSPYIAWGNLSIREIFQKAKLVKANSNQKRHLGAFISRLRWQAHFIQKFEMECIMETVSVNKGYHKLKKSISKRYTIAWETGQTGFPLVDAAMRCLIETGYLNFRMRAMLVSFFTHILWQPWQAATYHLSRNFLDFEPGIHFPQLQMQAGETGINNLRIYNPVKNGHEHDADAEFIKKWVPEIAHLPLAFIHEPYLMTTLDQQFNNCILGVDYPKPIVNIKLHRKKASDILWDLRKDPYVISESYRILQKHTIDNRSRMLKDE